MYKAFIMKTFETGNLLMFHVIKWAFWESVHKYSGTVLKPSALARPPGGRSPLAATAAMLCGLCALKMAGTETRGGDFIPPLPTDACRAQGQVHSPEGHSE